MRVAMDAFGGDNAPDEVIKGAAEAIKLYGDKLEIILCGDENRVNERIKALGVSTEGISVKNAEGIIKIEDNPTDIRKAKLNSSMGVAFQAVKNGEADAFISAGSTAALVVGGTTLIGRIKGIKRPSLAPIIPSVSHNYILLDGGANVECRPEMLQQFAVMGSVYMEKIMGVKNPKVGLLNVGAEEEKGRELEHEAYALLKEAPVNFIGNAEGREAALGECDVLVTDGFTGNVYLKTVEGMGKFMKVSLKGIFFKNIGTKIGAAFTMKGIKELSRKMDYRETGGSPLLGTSKPVIKAHGSSDAKAFMNAVRQAKEFIENNVIEEITAALESLKTETVGETEK
ncbi:MAG: phosphate acyltransferase PlsX [Firmicutes bacterium]|nr:phosphate acyltransferase PlsX [[Eubacterium] siraeum]MCM1487039.1 phosphate acyltransferase PlsX [Bacillota bacterium]